MEGFTVAIAAFMGVSLAAASGVRVFLPPFLLALSVRSGLVDIQLIGTQFEFFTSTPAIIILGIAMIAEFSAYYLSLIHI